MYENDRYFQYNVNKFRNWIFVQNKLFETRLNNNFYTLIRLLFFKCYINYRLLGNRTWWNQYWLCLWLC